MKRSSKELFKKKREKELTASLGEIDKAKEPYLHSLIHDFVEIEQHCKDLEGLPTFEVDTKNPKRQRKLPAHDMLKEWQQRKTEVTRAILRALDTDAIKEDSPLMAMLGQFAGGYEER